MIQIKPVGDRAVLAVLGDLADEETNRRVTELNAAVLGAGVVGIRETVPAFASLLIYYDPLVTDWEEISRLVHSAAGGAPSGIGARGRVVEIPVCYGGAYGEDLPFVAGRAGISREEVVKLHSGNTYRIYMLGFLPGFPYLGGLDPRLNTPRLDTPRIRIPAGSVGIGGEQTGIYPLDSPGGWRIIGRTPLRLFAPEDGGSIPYRAGDFIRFVPIGEAEFERIRREQKEGFPWQSNC